MAPGAVWDTHPLGYIHASVAPGSPGGERVTEAFDFEEDEALSDHTVELTTDNFQAEVLDSDVPVLVDFWAVWCAPCRMIAPIVEELAESYGGKVKVGKLNVDEHGDIAFRYNIRGIPALLMFDSGQVRDQMVGAGSRDSIVGMIEKVTAAHA